MFTGIITARGTVLEYSRSAAGARIRVSNPGFKTSQGAPAAPGESIAINGVCLTVLDAPPPTDSSISFDAITETLTKTTLDSLKEGQVVHMEHAATVGSLVGGHMVQGHVDEIGTVEGVQDAAHDWRLTVRVAPHVMRLIANKGSITIDGVSLTVAETAPERSTFTVALIPTTLDLTHLDSLSVGDEVNIETDVIARQVANYLDNAATLNA